MSHTLNIESSGCKITLIGDSDAISRVSVRGNRVTIPSGAVIEKIIDDGSGWIIDTGEPPTITTVNRNATPSPASMRAAKAIADAELTFLSGSTAIPRAKHVDDEINAIARIIDAEMGTADTTPPRVTDANGMGLDYHAGRTDGHGDAIRELREKVERLENRVDGVFATIKDVDMGVGQLERWREAMDPDDGPTLLSRVEKLEAQCAMNRAREEAGRA